jgi:hypothetical protein
MDGLNPVIADVAENQVYCLFCYDVYFDSGLNHNHDKKGKERICRRAPGLGKPRSLSYVGKPQLGSQQTTLTGSGSS